MEDDYGYDEGSDVDNWENEEVFQDGVLDRQDDADDDADDDDFDPREDFGHFGGDGTF